VTPTRYKIDAPILAYAPWAGGKRRLAPFIVDLLGEHDTYVEPFVGGCAILPQKAPCKCEIVNDANPAVVTVLRAVRDNPYLLPMLQGLSFDKEQFEACRKRLAGEQPEPISHDPVLAACQLVVWWMGANGYAGTTKTGWFAQRRTKTGGDPAVRWESFKRALPALSARLQGVGIRNQDFRQLLAERPHDLPGVAIYADPPYVTKRITYAHDFTPQDHADLAAILNRFRRARVVVSYYDAPELATLYPADRWERIEVGMSKSSANARTGATKTPAVELLLVNRRDA
jgi:DNA adenine methylase